jgi:hypothetical protein
MSLRRLLSARRLRLSCALVLFATLLMSPLPRSASGAVTPGVVAAANAASVLTQEAGGEQATLETRQPDVQWSASGVTGWQTVTDRQAVRSGDRVRTGVGAAARIVYFEGTVSDISAETGVLVQRLERSPEGNIVTRLFQSAGTTLHRVVQLTDPGASFEIDTPAATALVRGTTPRVQVAADGTARIGNVPDASGGTVVVQGKDADATQVTLQQGQETSVRPGQAPSPPTTISSQQGGQQQSDQEQQQMQQMQQQQALAMMAGQGIAASMAAQAGLANAAAAQQLQNQLLLSQLASNPNFPFSSFPVATGTLR